MKAAIYILALFLCGCGSMPRVRLGNMEASAPKDTGKPAVVSSDTVTTEYTVPEGTTVISEPAPEIDGGPVRLTLNFTRAMPVKITEARQSATSGTVDTTVAMRRVDNTARQPLLYAAIGAMVGAAAFLFLKYPTPALLCGAASVVFFVAWQAAGLPPWFWIIGAIAIAGGVALWIGHERGELSAKQP